MDKQNKHDEGFKCQHDNKDKAMHWKGGGSRSSTKHNALQFIGGDLGGLCTFEFLWKV